MAARDHHSGNLSPELALLGFLLAGPAHGYDLHQRFSADLGYVWHLSQSQAYAILKRLEDRGDIVSEVREQEKLPARQILHITDIGRRRFFEWLEMGVGKNARSIRLEFLTRLYFARLHRPKYVPHIYRVQAAEIKATIVRLEKLRNDLPLDKLFNRLSLDLRLRQMQLIQQWVEEIRTRLQIPERRR